MGTDPGCLERKRSGSGRPADGRQHRDPRASPCSGRKRGTPKEDLGRSKGGFSTKIHLRANSHGLPMRTEITPGQTSDYLGFEPVMADNLPAPRVLVADKGYDSDTVRESLAKKDILPVIPMRKNRKKIVAVDPCIYALRNLVERCFNRLKNARRVATRYDKTAASFLGFIDIVSIRLWVPHLST
jgi:transposase